MSNEILKHMLARLDSEFPFGEEISEKRWSQATTQLSSELWKFSDQILEVVAESVPQRVLSSSQQEMFVQPVPGIVVSHLRYRPLSSYYVKTGKPIPAPENPKGQSATGLEVGLLLCRGHPQAGRLRNAYLCLELSVGDYAEREAFRDFFRDHRRFVNKLLETREFKFMTATPFENVDSFKGHDVFKKLDLYLQNEFDPENHFTIEADMDSGSTVKEIVSVFTTLLILYDVALGYCQPRKSRDRAFHYARSWI